MGSCGFVALRGVFMCVGFREITAASDEKEQATRD
jgi:hypothetical protein